MPQDQGARIVDNVRKNSVMMPPAVSASSPPAQPARYPAAAPVPAPAPLTAPVSAPNPATFAPQPQRTPVSTSPANQSRRPQSQSPRPFANATRYSLADPGSGSAPNSRPPSSQSQSSTGPPRRDGRPSLDNRPEPSFPALGPGVPSGPPPKKGPATFAEMGITTAKVEEKDCIIM